jgi:hypothetical protein
MRLDGQIVSVCDLSPRDRDEMFALMQRHYDNVLRDSFETDLAEKQWVISLRTSASSELCGFSTQMVLLANVDGRQVNALFSGDTIIDQRYWGDPTLMYHGGCLSLALADASQGEDWYWFLISGGYKTYRFLPVFFHEFSPRYDRPTPPDVQQLIDVLAENKFGQRYDRQRQVIRSDNRQYRLREGVADITDERRRDPHVRYFLERNPGHAAGDELCCIARLSRANFTDAAHRVLRATATAPRR